MRIKNMIEHPKAVNETTLKYLCDKYRYEIGAGFTTDIPNIKVRYVIDTQIQVANATF